jgi:hypothetical protein
VLLTFRQPRLQYGKGIRGFFCFHRGNQFASSALMLPMTAMFAADIHHDIAVRDLDLIRFAKGQSKDEIARRYLAGHHGGERILFAGGGAGEDAGLADPPAPGPGDRLARTRGCTRSRRWSITGISMGLTPASGRST